MSQHYLINWIGGKRQLRKKIIPLIPEDIGSYIEPFGGGGWILFAREKWANVEVYNDLDSRLVNLFRIVQYHPDALVKEMELHLQSRELFVEFITIPARTDIQRAAQFLYLISRSFGGKGDTYGYSRKSSGGAKSAKGILDRIREITTRLDKVNIENLDYKDILRRYDYDNAFFYLDPPYVAGVGYKSNKNHPFSHEGLRQDLASVKGRWLLSYDDNPLVRQLYKDYNIIPVVRQKGINNTTVRDNIYSELLIANYKI